MSDSIQVVDAYSNDETMACLEYLTVRELGIQKEDPVTKKSYTYRYTMEEYADTQNISRQAAYKRTAKWDSTGLMRACRRVMSSAVLGEEALIANRRLIADWPAIAERLSRVALYASDKIAAEAAEWIYEHIVEPSMSDQEDPGSDEKNYITITQENPHAHDPMAVLTG